MKSYIFIHAGKLKFTKIECRDGQTEEKQYGKTNSTVIIGKGSVLKKNLFFINT